MRLNKHVCAARNQRKHDHAGWLQATTAPVLRTYVAAVEPRRV